MKSIHPPSRGDVPGVELLVVCEALVEVVVGRPPAAHPRQAVNLLRHHVGRCESTNEPSLFLSIFCSIRDIFFDSSHENLSFVNIFLELK